MSLDCLKNVRVGVKKVVAVPGYLVGSTIRGIKSRLAYLN